MLVSPTKAIAMYNVSKPTLYSDMKTGKLSFKINDRKKRKLDIAELERLYEKRRTIEERTETKTVKEKPHLTESNVSVSALEKELQEARENLANSQKRETELLKEQIEQLQNQVEKLNTNLNKALDITALIEDKREGQGTKESQWEARMEIMESQLTKFQNQNQRLQAVDKNSKEKIEELKNEIEEKNKSWIKRMFS